MKLNIEQNKSNEYFLCILTGESKVKMEVLKFYLLTNRFYSYFNIEKINLVT